MNHMIIIPMNMATNMVYVAVISFPLAGKFGTERNVKYQYCH